MKGLRGWAALGTMLGAGLLGAPAAAAFVPAGTASASATGTYAVGISPPSLAGGVSTSLTVTVTDEASSSLRLGALNLAAPSGFTPTAASLSSGSAGTATVSGSVVQLRRLGLTPGSSATATVTVTSACAAGPYSWTPAATNEPNFSGTTLALDSAQSSLSTDVTSGCSLQFSSQPADTVVTQPITAAALNPSGPPVQVQLLDGNGHLLSGSSAPVSMSLATNPGPGTLSGTTTVAASGGVASFSNLHIDQPANGYALLATSPGFAPATSSSFNEVTAGTTCPPGQSCSVGASTATSSLDMSTPPAPTSNTLTMSVDVGSSLQCAGYTAQDVNWYSFVSSSTAVGKTLTYQVRPSRALPETVGAAQFCLGAPYPFTMRGGTPAPPGQLPDGSRGFVGLVPPCSSGIPGPCLDTKTTVPDPSSPTGFDVVLRVLFPAGLPGDPWGKS